MVVVNDSGYYLVIFKQNVLLNGQALGCFLINILILLVLLPATVVSGKEK